MKINHFMLKVLFRRGFVDPNTGENLSYREILKRTLPDVQHKLPMLVVRTASLSNRATVKEKRYRILHPSCVRLLKLVLLYIPKKK